MTEKQLKVRLYAGRKVLIYVRLRSTANMKDFLTASYIYRTVWTVYVEFKGTSAGLSPTQKWWKNYLLASSPHRYYMVDTPEKLQG